MKLPSHLAPFVVFAGLAVAAPRHQEQQHHLTADVALDGPGHHDGVIDLSRWTIGQILNYTLTHADDPERRTPPLKKLARIANFSDGIIDYLKQEDISVTLFAPDDEALARLPDHGRDHDHDHDHDHERDDAENHPFMEALEMHDDIEVTSDDDDKDRKPPSREERRKIIKKIVAAVLKYHVLPEKVSAGDLLERQTVATALNQTTEYGTPFRIRVRPDFKLLPPPPSYEVSLNFYAKTRRGPSLLAKNGIIHLISAPLLPPLPPLDQLFLFPLTFSTLTSTIQQAGVDEIIAPYLHHHHDDDEKKGYLAQIAGLGDEQTHPTIINVLEELMEEALEEAGISTTDAKSDYGAWPFTVFAPTNLAFAKIPFKIRLFLLGPFGHRVLKKALSFHIIPQTILHTDYYLNATRSGKKDEIAVKNTVEELPAWFRHDDEGDDMDIVGGQMLDLPHLPGRRPGPPARGPPGRRPCPPGKDRPHSPEGHVHKFELPTLLGSQKNESLCVHVYEYRLGFGKGPKTRAIAVGNTEQDEHEYVKAVVSDGVAWGGAVHVINSLIRPPFAHRHEGHSDHDHEHHHNHDHHEHHGHRGGEHDHTDKHDGEESSVMAYLKAIWE